VKRFSVLEGGYSIHRLPPDSAVPEAVLLHPFSSVSRTRHELSIVASDSVEVPGARTESGWACLMLDGPFAFSEVGIVAGVTGAMAEAGVSVFVVSTFDTDYILVKRDNLAKALLAMRAAGYFASATHQSWANP
jgi:hypothetical protein